MKSKICWSLLVIILLLNFICINYVYADEDENKISYSEEEFEALEESGETSLGTVSSSTSAAAGATNMIVSLGSVIISPLSAISVFANNGGLYHTKSEYSASKVYWFNIASLVFDEYLVFNVDTTETASSLNSDIEATTTTTWMDNLKEFVNAAYQVSTWIAILVFFVLIVYTFIRFMQANTGEAKAKFRKTGRIWAKALIFMFLVRIIVGLSNVILASIMDILYNIRLSLEGAGYVCFETELFQNCREGLFNNGGFTGAMYFIELVLFTIIYFIFFGKYLKRSAMIFFLIVIAPVYAVVSVLKQLKNEKGVIGTWFNQYMSNTFIQPFHALMYLVFMITMSNVALTSPLVGLFLLYGLLAAEKIGSIILNFSKETIGSLIQKDK